MKQVKLFLSLLLLFVGGGKAMAIEFVIDGLKYSSTYSYSSSSGTITLPSNEVAVSLNMDKTMTVTDTVYYSYSSIPSGLGTNYNRTWTIQDDDGDGVGSSATYERINLNYQSGNTVYFYLRTHQIAYSDKKNVVVPKEVTYNGVTYKVTAVPRFGFNYSRVSLYVRERCSTYNQTTNQYSDSSSPRLEYDNAVSRRNDFLETVTFESFSNIKVLGDYSFMGCNKLTSVMVPASITYFGQGQFECCTALKQCLFQTLTSEMLTYYGITDTSKIGQVQWDTLSNWTFWYCTAIETLELPDGITTIAGRAKGAALQYMFSLKNIRLPNTLKTVQEHFLCCAKSLETLTIPASVTNLDGACFHGCENLHTVYLLGTAGSLSSGGGDTFGENAVFCAGHVNNCKFYTTQDYITSYANDQQTGVWPLIADNQVRNGSYWYLTDPTTGERVVVNNNYVRTSARGEGYSNQLIIIPEEKRKFTANKWVTAIFPNGVPANEVTSVFGSGTRVAIPSGIPTTSNKNGVIMYSVSFQLIDWSTNGVPEDTPVMFCPTKDATYTMITFENMADDNFKLDMTKEHVKNPLTADDGATISMKGKYVPYEMHPWDFYFMYKDKTVDEDGNATYTNPNERAKFYRVKESTTIGSTRCYWTINNASGVKTSGGMAPGGGNSKENIFFDDYTTGINEVNQQIIIEGIYDLNGRKLDFNSSDLPSGMYIKNGKKVIVK